MTKEFHSTVEPDLSEMPDVDALIAFKQLQITQLEKSITVLTKTCNKVKSDLLTLETLKHNAIHSEQI